MMIFCEWLVVGVKRIAYLQHTARASNFCHYGKSKYRFNYINSSLIMGCTPVELFLRFLAKYEFVTYDEERKTAVMRSDSFLFLIPHCLTFFPFLVV